MDAFLFFFKDTATTEIYTLSLHDALPISTRSRPSLSASLVNWSSRSPRRLRRSPAAGSRSEEHTSELQSHSDLVCRLLLEKKKEQRGPERTAVRKLHAVDGRSALTGGRSI